jgi:hypothetical protein
MNETIIDATIFSFSKTKYQKKKQISGITYN